MIRKEQGYIQSQLGPDTQQWINQHAKDWYRQWVTDTGAEQAVYRFMVPTETQRQNSTELENLGVQWFNWVEGRITALFATVQQMLVRLALLRAWLPFALLLMLPALWDGGMTRRIRLTNFDYTSPVIHRFSMVGLGYGVLLLRMALWMPVAIPPWVLPGFIMGLALLAGLALSHVQKRV